MGGKKKAKEKEKEKKRESKGKPKREEKVNPLSKNFGYGLASF